jgi:hypothetical protein
MQYRRFFINNFKNRLKLLLAISNQPFNNLTIVQNYPVKGYNTEVLVPIKKNICIILYM